METTRIACPSCQKRLKVPAKSEGKKVICPRCETSFKIQIPQFAQPSVADSIQVADQGAMGPASNFPQTLPAALPQTRLVTHRTPQTNNRRKVENNWRLIGWGAALTVIAFVSAALPGIEDPGRGGRGIVKLLKLLLFFLGPYSPLLGIVVGLVGVSLAVAGFKQVTRAISLPCGVVVAGLVIATCATSFVSAIGTFNTKRKDEREHIAKVRQQLSESQKRIDDTAAKARKHRAEENAKTLIRNRFIHSGESLFSVKNEGFKDNSVPKRLGDIAGDLSTARIYYTDSPVTAIAFFETFFGYFVGLAEIEDEGPWIARGNQGEILYGMNLNFENGELAGVQPIFGELSNDVIDRSTLREGKWMGSSAAPNRTEQLSGNGKPILGMALDTPQTKIQGIQLIIPQ